MHEPVFKQTESYHRIQGDQVEIAIMLCMTGWWKQLKTESQQQEAVLMTACKNPNESHQNHGTCADIPSIYTDESSSAVVDSASACGTKASLSDLSSISPLV